MRPCVYCYVCVAQPFFDRRVRCAVNPVAAREHEVGERLRTKTDRPRHVLVVGGGPAGMEAASVAAQRGHRVTLVEQSPQLGGTLRFAALAYEPNERLLRFLTQRVRDLPIELRLGEAATPALVRALSPDLVIAAPGARRTQSRIPGADLPHVLDGDDLRALLRGDAGAGRLSALGRLAGWVGRISGISDDPAKLRRASRAYLPLGRRIAVIGGGLVGIEVAGFLVERGRAVTVIEEGPVPALDMAHPRRWRVLHDLREAGVRIETRASVSRITRRRVVVVIGGDEGPARSEEIAVDTVIVATGLVANPEPIEALRGAGVPVVAVGDAGGVGYIEGAIHDGFRAAIEL